VTGAWPGPPGPTLNPLLRDTPPRTSNPPSRRCLGTLPPTQITAYTSCAGGRHNMPRPGLQRTEARSGSLEPGRPSRAGPDQPICCAIYQPTGRTRRPPTGCRLRDRQTSSDVTHTSSLNAPGRGHNKAANIIAVVFLG